jgi:hypothetical protein
MSRKRPGLREANTLQAVALGMQVGLRLVSIRPGFGETEARQAAA